MSKKAKAKKSARKPTPIRSLQAAGRKLKARSAKEKKPRGFIGSIILRGKTAGYQGPLIVKPGEDLHAAAARHLELKIQTTRMPRAISVKGRHRKEMGDLLDLARSIDARGLLHPIVITPQNKLIAGQRRLAAWALTKRSNKGKLPIPVTVIDIDSIVAGEWDENAERKDFTPSESVAIMAELEPRERAAAKKRQAQHAAAPGRKAAPIEGKGAAADKVAKVVGRDRKTLAKAKEVVEAAKADPKKFGQLQADMDRTGKVNGPHKRLQVMQQTEAIRKAPPPAPMQGPYSVAVIDCPWPGDAEKEQAALDAAGRAFRPYAEMSVKSLCTFMHKEVAPVLQPDCVVWFWATNFHLAAGYAHHVIAALGFEGKAKTILTWGKDKIGRGQILRDKSEQCLLLIRGNPVVNVFGEDPPSTLLLAGRRDNSQKPDEFYRLVERVTPAARYASFFSRGGEGKDWDCHGDQVGKYAIAAPGPARKGRAGAPAADPAASAAARKAGHAKDEAAPVPAQLDLTIPAQFRREPLGGGLAIAALSASPKILGGQ